MKIRTIALALGLMTAQVLPAPARAESPLLDVPNFPDFALLGVGRGPRYLGSDEDTVAVAPAVQLDLGSQYVSLQANYLSINLMHHGRWQAGPAGILRFGRRNVDNPQIDALPDVDMSVDLGGFLAYEFGGPDPRDRWRFNFGALQDVTGAHGGMVADFGIRRWLPVGRYGAFGLAAAASWGSEDYMDTYFSVSPADALLSGLPSYSAGPGWRDARAMALFVQPVSREWAVGAGLLYSYLLQDAGSSPVTLSRDQLYFGIGIARAW